MWRGLFSRASASFGGRHDGVDACRAPGRQRARRDRDAGEHGGDGDQHGRIGRADGEQLTLQALAQRDRTGGAEQEAAGDDPKLTDSITVDLRLISTLLLRFYIVGESNTGK